VARGSHGSDDTDDDEYQKKLAALPSPSEPPGFVFDDLKWQLCSSECKKMHEDCDKYCCEVEPRRYEEDPDEEYEDDAIDDDDDCYQLPKEGDAYVSHS
jgi:hypothetical protein